MMLVVAGLMLVALTGLTVWFAAGRCRHLGIIALAAVPLVPLLASTVTGDVSRYLPAPLFSDDAAGKDEVIVASAVATVLLSVMLAAGVFAAGKALWRRRSAARLTPEDR
jgi:hypothetical protein